jgi:hypothetical protein
MYLLSTCFQLSKFWLYNVIICPLVYKIPYNFSLLINFHRKCHRNKHDWLGIMIHSCNLGYSGCRGLCFEASPGKCIVTPLSQKQVRLSSAHLNPVTQKAEVGGSWLKAYWGKSTTPNRKTNKRNKRTGGIAQVVEHLPSNCKALSLFPSNTIKKKKKKNKEKKLWLEGFFVIIKLFIGTNCMHFLIKWYGAEKEGVYLGQMSLESISTGKDKASFTTKRDI